MRPWESSAIGYWKTAILCLGMQGYGCSGVSLDGVDAESGDWSGLDNSRLLETGSRGEGASPAEAFSDESAFAMVGRAGLGTEDPLGAIADECSPSGLTMPTVRRLSRVELLNTLEDLLGEPVPGADEFSLDASVQGFENNARSLGASTVWVEQVALFAQWAAQGLAQRETAYCQTVPSCGDDVVARLGQRAFRRPLGTEELARFNGLYAELLKSVDEQQAVSLVAEALLQSPSFLYRELPLPPGAESFQRLAPYAVASRLSYWLWQSMPDEALLASAQSGRLMERDEVIRQARRMLQQPRALDTVLDFHRQWLGLERVLDEVKEVEDYPEWDTDTSSAAVSESLQLVEAVFTQRGGSVRELLVSREAIVNEQLAELYEVPFDPSNEQLWQRVQLPERRAGLLTRIGFLAGLSHPATTSPPLRGVAVLDKLLCSSPPPAPASADTSTPTSEPGVAVTTRELFERRTAPDACQGCHQSINGIGMAFEQFDTLGRFRLLENGLPIDASGQVSLSEAIAFDGVVELSQRLADSEQTVTCAVTNLYRSAFGQTEGRDDACRLRALRQAVIQGEGNLLEAVVAIAASEAFLGLKLSAEEVSP